MADAGPPRMTLVDSIVNHHLRMIEQGLLQPGQRVASIRKAASDRAVSKNTMSSAYDRLVALARLEAQPGSGYVVSATTLPVPETPRPHIAEALDLVSLLREQLDQHYEVRPGDGRPPASWMEGSELSSQFNAAKLVRGEVEHGYGSSWGYLPLRERICLSLAERSIQCTPGQILMTHGANHALDLIMRDRVEPGDVVLVDDPGYYPLYGKLRLAKAQIVGIRRTPDGPDLDDLAAKLLALRPKLFFTQSLAHNPTGGSLSLGTAHGLLQLAERHDFHIVEDDPFADILPAASPRLAALDQLNRVLYVGTFSKTLSASLRVGYVAAHPKTVADLSHIKLVTVVATSDHTERFVFGLMSSGHYLRHLRRLRGRVADATTRALADLDAIGLPVARPRDGGFLSLGGVTAGSRRAGIVPAGRRTQYLSGARTYVQAGQDCSAAIDPDQCGACEQYAVPGFHADSSGKSIAACRGAKRASALCERRPERANCPQEMTEEHSMQETRRAVLAMLPAGLAAAVGQAHAQGHSATVPWSTGTEGATLKAPPNATDCHHHIYEGRFPLAPSAVLKPGDATVADYRNLQRRIGTTRHVVVQPSTYGTDNSCLLDAMQQFGLQNTRAVAVVDTSVGNAELDHLAANGVRGIRFNLAQAGVTTVAMIKPLAQRVAPRGWHIQVNADADLIVKNADLWTDLPCPVVFDHLAHVPEPEGPNHPVFPLMLKLLATGKTWIKLSGAYADTKSGPPAYADSSIIARAYVQAAPAQLVWGSDWPHPTEAVNNKPDDALLFDLLANWAPDEAVRNRILVDNAARLYDFT